jgi:hypothetical protein
MCTASINQFDIKNEIKDNKNSFITKKIKLYGILFDFLINKKGVANGYPLSVNWL